MGKQVIASMEDSSGKEITVTRTDPEPFVQVATLGFAGNASYSVKEDGKTVDTPSTRADAIESAAKRASR